MELTAVLRALEALPGEDVLVRADSQYVVRCFTERWYERWRRNGFRNAKGDPVANQDLWEALLALALAPGRSVAFEWVRGHAGDPANELVNDLAQRAARAEEAAGRRQADGG
jgi:ribonuclease HI